MCGILGVHHRVCQPCRSLAAWRRTRASWQPQVGTLGSWGSTSPHLRCLRRHHSGVIDRGFLPFSPTSPLLVLSLAATGAPAVTIGASASLDGGQGLRLSGPSTAPAPAPAPPEADLHSDSEYEVGLEMNPEWAQQLAATQARRNRRWVGSGHRGVEGATHSLPCHTSHTTPYPHHHPPLLPPCFPHRRRRT